MKASLLAIPAVVAVAVGGAKTGGHTLTLRQLEASVRGIGLTYMVLPGTTIVQANSRGQYPNVWVNIRIFPNATAMN